VLFVSSDASAPRGSDHATVQRKQHEHPLVHICFSLPPLTVSCSGVVVFENSLLFGAPLHCSLVR